MKKITLGIASVVLTLAMSLGVSAQTSLRDGHAASKAYPTVELATLQSMPALGSQKVVPNRTPRTHKLGGIATKTVSLTMSVSNIQDYQADLELSFASGVEVIYGTMPASTFNNWVEQYSAGDTAAEVYDDLMGNYAQNLGNATTSGTVTLSNLQVGTEYAVLALACGNGDTTAYWQFFTTTGDMPTVTLSNITQNDDNCMEFNATLTGGATGYYVYLIDSALLDQYYDYYFNGYISYTQLLQYCFGGDHQGDANGAASICNVTLGRTYYVYGYAWNDTDTSNSELLGNFTTLFTGGGTGDATVVATFAGAGTTWVAINLDFNDQASFYRAGLVDTATWNEWVARYNYTLDSLLPMIDNMSARAITTTDTLYNLTANTEYLFMFAAYNQNGERANLTTAPLAWDTVVCSTSGQLGVTISNLEVAAVNDSSASFHIEGVNGCTSYDLYILDTFYIEYLDRNWTDDYGNTMQDYMQYYGWSALEFTNALGWATHYADRFDNSMSASKDYDYSEGLEPGRIYVVFANAYIRSGWDIIDSNMCIELASFATNWTDGGTGVPTLELTTNSTSFDGHEWTVNFTTNDEYAFCHFLSITAEQYENYFSSDASEVEDYLAERTGWQNYAISGNDILIGDELAPQTQYYAFAIPYNKVWQAGEMASVNVTTAGIMPMVDVALAQANCHSVDFTFTANSATTEYTVVFVDDEHMTRAESYMQNGYTLPEIVDGLNWKDSLASTITVTVSSNDNPYTYTYEGADGNGINYGQTVTFVIYATDDTYTNLYEYADNTELAPYFHEECEGIEDAEMNTTSIYPNPASSVLNIKADAIDHVEFYNALGQQVRSERINANEATLDLSNMARGIYMLKVYNGESYTTTKLVVE